MTLLNYDVIMKISIIYVIYLTTVFASIATEALNHAISDGSFVGESVNKIREHESSVDVVDDKITDHVIYSGKLFELILNKGSSEIELVVSTFCGIILLHLIKLYTNCEMKLIH